MKYQFLLYSACLTTAYLFMAIDCNSGDWLCKGDDCGTKGTCDPADGKCECETGYEINYTGRCDSISKIKFIGTYSVHDECTNGNRDYTITILNGSTDISNIILNNFGDYHTNNEQLRVSANVQYNTIDIPAQTLTFNDEYHINETSATLTDSSFTLVYKLDKNGVLDLDCTAVYTKQ